MYLRIATYLIAILITTAGAAAYHDVTDSGAIPNDNLDDAPAIRNALLNHREVYFPPGEYVIGSTIFVPSERSLVGAGIDITKFRLGADTVAFRVNGRTDVYFQGFTIDRPFDNSRDEMIFVYNGAQRVRIEHVKTTNHRSRAPALSFINSTDGAVRHCITVDNMRNIFEDGHDQIYGSGITFASCTNVIVEYNSVYETRDLTNPNNPYFNYHQAGAIQVSGCTNARVEYNTISIAGQAIDMGGTDGALVRGNIIDNCHSIGIKLVNGSKNQRVIGNVVSRAGLAAISLGPGNTDRAIVDCLVENNTIIGVGQGYGAGWWQSFGFMTDSVPAAVHFDSANSQQGRSHSNTVRGTRIYDTAQMAYGVIVRISDLSAYNITLQDNQTLAGPPPAPTPTPTPAPVSVPLTLRNASATPGQGLEQLADQRALTAGLLAQGAAAQDSRWSFIVDLAQTTRVGSVALYGSATYRADEAAPGGLVRIEGAETLYGDYLLLGEHDFGNDRAANPLTGSKGKRILLNPGHARFLRISGGPWQASFDNNVVIAEVVVNPSVVIDDLDPVHNPNIAQPNPAGVAQQAVWDSGGGYEADRLALDLVDGKPWTGSNPHLTPSLTLDVASHSAALPRVTALRLRPFETDYALMPRTGTLRGSSTDDPANMDQLLTSFNVAHVDGIVTIPLPAEQVRRYYRLDITGNQAGSNAAGQLRLGEIELVDNGLAIYSCVSAGEFLFYE